MENNKDESLSIIDLIKFLWRNKIVYIVTILTLLIVVIPFVSLKYNKNAMYYTAEFEYDFPGIKESMYPNGENFNYKAIVSETVLNTIKQSNASYSSIDTKEILKNYDLSIKLNEVKNTNTDKINTTYTISVPAKYFKNQSVGYSFVKDLVYYAYNKAIESSKEIDISAYLDLYKTYDKYEDKIEALKKQKDLIVRSYQDLITDYGDLNVDGTPLSIKIANLESYFIVNDISLLESELVQKNYVKELEKYRSELEILKNKYQLELNQNIQKIEVYKNQYNEIKTDNPNNTTNESVFAVEIFNLTKRNQELLILIENIESKLTPNYTEEEEKAFAGKLSGVESKLNDYTKLYETDAIEILSERIYINYLNDNIVELSGGISVIVVIFLVTIVGFVLACSISYILENKKEIFTKETK